MKLRSMASALLATACFTAASWAAETPESANLVNPLLIGGEIPAVELVNMKGETVNLQEMAKKKASVIVFFRGAW